MNARTRRTFGPHVPVGKGLSALGRAAGADEGGGVIGLNGPLVALLCIAYFVLIVCALSSDGWDVDREVAVGSAAQSAPVSDDEAFELTARAG